MITDGHGLPLAVILTGGNRNDVTQPRPLIDAIPPIRGRVEHPRHRPDSVFADRGYDRDQVRKRRIVPAIVRRGTLHGTGRGKYRWVVERSFAGTTTSNASASVKKHIRPSYALVGFARRGQEFPRPLRSGRRGTAHGRPYTEATFDGAVQSEPIGACGEPRRVDRAEVGAVRPARVWRGMIQVRAKGAAFARWTEWTA